MDILDYNPVAENWNARYNTLSAEKRQKIAEAANSDLRLLEIKRKRQKIQTGDVFLLQPRKGIYFFGRVIKANLISKDGKQELIDGANIVFIFSCKTNALELGGFTPDYHHLLMGPAIVTNGYWTRGLFYNVGNFPLSDLEKELDYGFFELSNGIRPGFFCNEKEERLNRIPKYYDLLGTQTISGVAWGIERELIINPMLLL